MISIYRNEESSQTKLEAETDGARSKDRKIQMTVNNEINSIEKSTTNLDLALNWQIRQNIWKDAFNYIFLFVDLELDLGLWLIFLYYLFHYLQSFASSDP